MKKLSVAVILVSVAVAGAWFYFRPLPPRSLLALLPVGDAPIVYFDVKAIRAAGVLEKIAGPATLEDPEYKGFVAATGFDYRRDLDAVLLMSRPGDTLMVVAGAFDLERLAQYAKANGGHCAGELCSLQGSAPQRQISWTPLRRHVLGLAVSPDPMAATLVVGNATPPTFPLPAGAAWAHIPGSALRPGAGLPPGLSALLSALEGAQYAQFTASASEVTLVAPCGSREKATALAARLAETADTLRKLLAQEKSTPNPLATTLVGGVFKADALTLRGRWPLKW